MLSALKHYSDIYFVQIKNNWVREALYRSNFLTTVLVDLGWIGVEFCFFTVIYSNVPTLAGWTKPQVYFFLGIFFSSDALFTVFFQTNFWRFSDLVNKGELDIILTKPINALFLVLTRWISLTAILNFALGIFIAVKYSGSAGFEGGWKWLLLVFWLLIGLFVQLLLRFAFSIWVFWTERSWALARLYYQFYQIATKPDTLYPVIIRYLILTFIPFAFVGSVPARALLHGLELKEYALLASIILFFTTANLFLWHRGLKRYQSASS